MTQQDIDDVYEMLIGLAPPFAKVEPSQVKVWISFAEDFVCEKKLKTKFKKALALYTLHMMVLDGAFKDITDSVESMGRRVSSFSLSGEFSQTFSDATRTSEAGDVLTQTPWGKMYRALIRKSGGRMGLLTGLRGGCR